MRICFPDFKAVSVLPNVFPNHQKLIAELKAIDHSALAVLDPDRKRISIHWIFRNENGEKNVIPILTLQKRGRFPLRMFEDNDDSPVENLIRALHQKIEDTPWIKPVSPMTMDDARKYIHEFRQQIYDFRCLFEAIRILNFPRK